MPLGCAELTLGMNVTPECKRDGLWHSGCVCPLHGGGMAELHELSQEAVQKRSTGLLGDAVESTDETPNLKKST